MIDRVLEALGAPCVEEGARARFYLAATEASPLYRILRGRVAAMTFGRHVLFIGLDAISNPTIRRHELIHVEQYRREGGIALLARYLLAYLGARLSGLTHHEAYVAIPHEADAYQHEQDDALPSDP